MGFLPSDSLTTTLTFSAGASVNGIECATLSADDDELLEQFIESFTVTISSVTLGMISGITTSTVNIQDDERELRDSTMHTVMQSLHDIMYILCLQKQL